MLNEGLPDPCAFYHANSFAPRPSDPEDVLGTADYGGEFVSVVERPPVYGLQSHPEKSGPDGLRLLKNFVRLAQAIRARMILLPAVDIRDGKAVRLRQGHFDEETVYADDPLEAARSFVEAGARFLHVVDLDGAREGEPVNLHHVERITRELEVPVELGGGLRSIASIRRALKAGADRVVLGTAAFTDPDLLDEALAAFTARVLVGVDVRDGKVSVSGWTRETQMRGEDAIRLHAGARRDAASSTPTSTATGCSRAPTSTRSGGSARPCAGASSTRAASARWPTCEALRDLRLVNLAGVISGKALYEQPLRGRRGASGSLDG